MNKQGQKNDLARLCLERCDELEDMAIKMAREVCHLRSMLAIFLSDPAKTPLEETLANLKHVKFSDKQSGNNGNT